MTLHLEYNCTRKEREEAQVLHFGRGSKRRGLFLYIGAAIVALVAICLRLKYEIPSEERRWLIPLIVIVTIMFVAYKRVVERRKLIQTVRVDVSERDLVFNSDKGRSNWLWSAFGSCVESPNIFVLVDRPKQILFIIPKRAFPDDASRDWFRAQANQISGVVPATSDQNASRGQFSVKNGVTLSFKYGYVDYLNRIVTSWRMRGIAIALYLFLVGMNAFMAINPPPNAVNGPGKVFLIMLSIVTPMLVAVMFAVAFITWLGERKYRTAQQVGLDAEGIQMTAQDSSSRIPWSSYKHYLENRWAFFLWGSGGVGWFMIPKRALASNSDLRQCRELLQANLKASRWFHM